MEDKLRSPGPHGDLRAGKPQELYAKQLKRWNGGWRYAIRKHRMLRGCSGWTSWPGW